jgi:hypothetical protein
MARMTRPNRWLVLPLAVTLLAALSCTADTPTAPVAPPEASLLGGLLSATGLLNCTPMPTASASATIGPDGGTMVIGPHTFVVPPGALESPITITALAPSAKVNEIEFQPSGLVFERSASLTMSYANCNLLGKLLPKRIAWVDGNLNILSYLLSLDNLFAKQVTGQVDHFTSYAVAW